MPPKDFTLQPLSVNLNTVDESTAAESRTTYHINNSSSFTASMKPSDYYALMFKVSETLTRDILTPKHIIHNVKDDSTIVIWKDGTKTIVKPMEGVEYDAHTAFTSALAKKIFGSGNQVKKIVKTVETPQKRKPKNEEPAEKTSEHDYLTLTRDELLEALRKHAEVEIKNDHRS